jgi:hypothetical protein
MEFGHSARNRSLEMGNCEKSSLGYWIGVKFGDNVTRGIVKVPEKFGIDWSTFGWFGYFTKHVACSVLVFWRNGQFRL